MKYAMKEGSSNTEGEGESPLLQTTAPAMDERHEVRHEEIR